MITSHFDYEERQQVERASKVLDAVVAPSLKDAVIIAEQTQDTYTDSE